jgi:cellulose synthase/poly-beta-1,6-N-acetylglucosamine synthase-like glycosyltransferase
MFDTQTEALIAPLPRASVIVAVYNAQPTLRECIESLLRLDYPRSHLELLCVDNASTDATSSILASYGGSLRTLREARRGPAAARNTGLRHAGGEVVALTDADCVVDGAWLRHLVAPLRDPSVGVVGGRILSRGRTPIERFGERIHDHDRALNETMPPYAITMNWAARRDVLTTVGGFNEELLRCSDVDLSYRIVQAGYRLVYEPQAIIYHRNERTPWGLMHEGYVHGYHAVKVLALHDAFLQQVRAAQRAAPDPLPLRPPTPQRGRDAIWWRLFNLGKRVGRLHASWVATPAQRRRNQSQA